MGTVQCFWLEPTNEACRSLRRYHPPRYDTGPDGKLVRRTGPADTCASRWKYHNAEAFLDRLTVANREDEPSGDRWPHDDPRWPTHCECGYAFTDDDAWQLNVNTVYRAADGREVFGLIHDVPPGAMWDADWMFESYRGPDGIYLTVMLPDGTPWGVDGPATGGGHWTREGDPKANPPTVTANPSIASGNPQTYHGWLRNGQLVDA